MAASSRPDHAGETSKLTAIEDLVAAALIAAAALSRLGRHKR